MQPASVQHAFFNQSTALTCSRGQQGPLRHGEQRLGRISPENPEDGTSAALSACHMKSRQNLWGEAIREEHTKTFKLYADGLETSVCTAGRQYTGRSCKNANQTRKSYLHSHHATHDSCIHSKLHQAAQKAPVGFIVIDTDRRPMRGDPAHIPYSTWNTAGRTDGKRPTQLHDVALTIIVAQEEARQSCRDDDEKRVNGVSSLIILPHHGVHRFHHF